MYIKEINMQKIFTLQSTKSYHMKIHTDLKTQDVTPHSNWRCFTLVLITWLTYSRSSNILLTAAGLDRPIQAFPMMMYTSRLINFHMYKHTGWICVGGQTARERINCHWVQFYVHLSHALSLKQGNAVQRWYIEELSRGKRVISNMR